MYACYALPVVDAILHQASNTIKLSHRNRITTFTTEASSFSTRHLDNIDPTRVIGSSRQSWSPLSEMLGLSRIDVHKINDTCSGA